MNVYTKCHVNLSKQCGDISLKTKKVNLTVALEGKSRDHKVTRSISVQNVMAIYPIVGEIQYFSLDQGVG